ncbi:MAG: DNA polymerase/3'-5' exonuclease PolX [Nitrospirae bacterium]|nr:MAG: DNA polymerase/3'-5' exonuclease PolX [Nitrospirota bacterium]
MTKAAIADILQEIALLLEIKGENPFKAKAYSAAARAVETLPDDPAVLLEKGELQNVKGIGEGISATVRELITSGTSSLHAELQELFPSGLMELADVPGLGAKKIKVIYERLGISTVGELQYACIENRLVDLPGFGLKTQEKILAGLRQYHRNQGFHLYKNVIEDAERILQTVRDTPGVSEAELAGEFRRRMEVIQDISIVMTGGEPTLLMERLAGIKDVTGLDFQPDSSTITARSPQGISVTIKIVGASEYGWQLIHATGSSEHVALLEARLKERGAHPKGSSEDAIYAAAGLPYIVPELREGHGEIELAQAGRLPVLLEPGQIRGFFHTHTLYSDGAASVEDMVGGAKALGYRYIGISDHSQSAFYANGLKEDRIRAQHAEIAAVQKKLPGIRIFKGIESDILVDGSLDYPDEVLAMFDFVIGSVHSRFNLLEEDQTHRICRALTHPYLTMLGHATGRLLLSRDGYRVDLRKVIETAAAHRKIVEINASPHRLELNWRLCGYAKLQGVKFSINPDAHSVEALSNVPFGVNIARKGGLGADDIVNTLSVEGMESLLRSMKPAATA